MKLLNKEEYYERLICELFHAYKEDKEKTCAIAVGDEAQACEIAENEIEKRLQITSGEFMFLGNNDIAEAYDEYCEQNEPLHDYELTISVNYSTSIHVKAEDEEEAREYVTDNLCANSTEVYMGDDENVLEDLDTGCDDAEWEIEDVYDCGECEE